MHEHHSLLRHVGRVQSADEELIVGLVDGVAALEGHDGLPRWQVGTHLPRCLRLVLALGQSERRQLAAQIDATALAEDHAHRGVLDRRRPVASGGLSDLVGRVDVRDVQHGQVLPLVGEQYLVTDGDVVFRLAVERDGQAEKQPVGKAGVGHDGLVVRLRHEAFQRAEPAHGEELDVARVAVAALECLGGARLESGTVGLGGEEVDEGATVGDLESIGADGELGGGGGGGHHADAAAGGGDGFGEGGGHADDAAGSCGEAGGGKEGGSCGGRARGVCGGERVYRQSTAAPGGKIRHLRRYFDPVRKKLLFLLSSAAEDTPASRASGVGGGVEARKCRVG